MRTPTFSTKRAIGVAAAAALALTGVIGFAGSSQAVVASLTLSPKTGSSAGGTIVTLTGKGFQTAAGASTVGNVFFSLTTCAAAASPTLAATVTSVISDTKISITTPALALVSSKPTAYNLCVDNVGDSAVSYASTFTSYTPPTIVATTGLSTTAGASFGGGTLTITGDNFTTKATASINGKLLTNTKVVVGASTNDDTITGTVPAGTGTSLPVVVTTEGGPGTTSTQSFTYLDSIKVNSPAYGNGTDNDVISITGSGFAARTFNAAASVTGSTVIALVPGGSALAVAGTVPTTKLCDTVQVESDTDLSCQISGAVTDGAYSVVLMSRAATATAIATITAVSRSATYTVSDF
jgi:hypothetical protein